MTYQDREQIFSKECLTIEDIMLLLDMKYQDSAKLIRDIKTHLKLTSSLRIDIQGKLHTEDYFDYFKIIDKQRYVKEVV